MRRRQLFLLGFSLLGLGFLGASSVKKPSPKLLYNPSESAPIGWYRVEPIAEMCRGDLVISHLPVGAERMAVERAYLPAGVPVIKTVWALEGDTVCVRERQLVVTGKARLAILAEDRLGRPLRAWREDCAVLGSEDVFLVSNEIPESFDSRYFGPVRVRDVIGRAVFLGDGTLGSEGRVEESAGDMGDCKIKAHGANAGLVPCLHISFYGSTRGFAEPGRGPFLNDCSKMAWFHWTFEADFTCSVPQ
jgi:conjugative transfer signal peptidase TraF